MDKHGNGQVVGLMRGKNKGGWEIILGEEWQELMRDFEDSKKLAQVLYTLDKPQLRYRYRCWLCRRCLKPKFICRRMANCKRVA